LAAIECNVIGSHGGNGPKKTVHTTKGRAARTAAAADMTVHSQDTQDTGPAYIRMRLTTHRRKGMFSHIIIIFRGAARALDAFSKRVSAFTAKEQHSPAKTE
jgi:hypothetical protein